MVTSLWPHFFGPPCIVGASKNVKLGSQRTNWTELNWTELQFWTRVFQWERSHRKSANWTAVGELDVSVAQAPADWNTLPSDLHDTADTGTFGKRLKSVGLLFDRAYRWLLSALLDVSCSDALQISLQHSIATVITQQHELVSRPLD